MTGYKFPRVGYKYMASHFADAFVSEGIMKVGTAEEYRQPDGKTGARADENEAIKRWEADQKTIYKATEHPVMRNYIVGSSAHSIEMRGGIFEDVTDAEAYLFCFSLWRDTDLDRRMKDEFDADACVRINDVRQMFDAIRVVDPLFPLDAVAGRVRYIPDFRQIPTDDLPAFLIKAEDYSWQREYRFAFPDPSASRDAIIKAFPKSVGLCTRLF